jgi:hypothetical protein
MNYISIAHKYLHGDFKNAINGYWGPLFSWCLVPFLWTGLDPLVACKILSLMTGIFVFIGVHRLCKDLGQPPLVINIILIVLVPTCLFFAFAYITSDLMLACMLLFYVSYLLKKDYPEKAKYGFMSGVFGGLANFSKAYAFPFFLLHFTLTSIVYFFVRKEVRRNIIKNFMWGLLPFLILSGSWVVMNNMKYHRFVYGIASKYNFMNIAPNKEKGLYNHSGFVAPPNPTAFSSWEDPTIFVRETWSPTDSFANFKYFFFHVSKNIWGVSKLYAGFWSLKNTIFNVLIPFILFFSGFFIFKNLKNPDSFLPVFLMLMTVLIYPVGYIVLVLDDRYFWLSLLLCLVLAGELFGRLMNSHSKKFKTALVVFLFVFITRPVVNLYFQKDKDLDFYKFSTSLKEKYQIDGTIASNNNWEKTVIIAYHLNSRYYGRIRKGARLAPEEVEADLLKNNIKYFFVWQDGRKEFPFLNGYREITNNELAPLKVYLMKTDR